MKNKDIQKSIVTAVTVTAITILDDAMEITSVQRFSLLAG